MSKFLKENAPYLLVLLVVIVIALILIFKPKEKPLEGYDLSKVKVIKIEEALELYKDVEPHVYIIGRSNCSACQSFMPAVNKIIDEYKIDVYYIDLLKMDEEPEAQEELLKLLTYQVTYDNKQGALAMFMGYTPMIFISSNNETIYGTLGSYEKSAFEAILKEYSIIK